MSLRGVLALLALAVASGVRQVKRREVVREALEGSGKNALSKFEAKLKELVMTRSSGVSVSMDELGKTAKNNVIWAVRMRGEDFNADEKAKKVLLTFNLLPLDADSRAATALYAINELEKMPALLEGNVEVVVVPMADPDGFQFAQSYKDGKRLKDWKKNAPSTESECQGVNLNRNFNKGWKPSSESEKCSQEYPGPEADSESETKAFKQELKAGTLVHVNVGAGTATREVRIGYDCEGCGRITNYNNYKLASVMTRAMTKEHGSRHSLKALRGDGKSGKAGTMKDFALDKGVLSVDLHTSSQEECLAGLIAAITFAGQQGTGVIRGW